MKPLTLTLLLPLLFLLPAHARAQNGKVEVDPGDTPLSIKGRVGEEEGFVAGMRLTLRDAPQSSGPVKLIVLPSDLRSARGAVLIGRQQVTVTGEQTLTPETPSNFQVKVTGVKEYGEYTGKIELLLAGQSREKATVVPLTVVAEVRPALTLLPESDKLKANLVNCRTTCWLARMLLPASNFQNRLQLHFEKPLAAPLEIIDKTFLVKGERTQFELTDAHMTITQPSPEQAPAAGPSPQPLSDKRYVDLKVELTQADIPVDHYTGAVYMKVAGVDSDVKVPVDVSVRMGPLPPLFFLLVGILLGRLFKYMREKGNPKADALVSLSRVEYRTQSADPADSNIIRPALERARGLINEDQVERAVPLIKSADSRLATLNELRDIEARLTGNQHPKAREVVRNLSEARELLRQGEDAEAAKTLVAIKEVLVKLSVTMMGADDQPDPSIVAASESAGAAAAASIRAAQVVSASAPAADWKGVRGWLAWLTGLSDEIRSEATRWLLRPMLWLFLLLSLVVLGMKTLYVDNPVFGSDPFTDFTSLIFWGLSADVASRTLGDIKVAQPGGPAGG
jgi:hypothetical protein